MPASGGVDLYGASYRNFARLHADIRREAFGDDIGQTGWLTAEEQDLFLAWLGLSQASHLLDVACGSGRPTLRIAQKTGCRVSGVNLRRRGDRERESERKGDGGARRFLRQCGRAAGVRGSQLRCHHVHRCDKPSARSTTRARRMASPAEAGRVLLPTDPIVLTGPVTKEVAIRASIGLFVFVPTGLDETMLEQAGFEVERVEDRTATWPRPPPEGQARARRDRTCARSTRVSWTTAAAEAAAVLARGSGSRARLYACRTS